MSSVAKSFVAVCVVVCAVLCPSTGSASILTSHVTTISYLQPNVVWNDTKIYLATPTTLTANFPNVADGNVAHFFVAPDGVGTSTVVVNGISVTIPVANAVNVGQGQISSEDASTQYTVPSDRRFIGVSLRAIAVTVVNGQAITTTFALSGPILGDDIS